MRRWRLAARSGAQRPPRRGSMRCAGCRVAGCWVAGCWVAGCWDAAPVCAAAAWPRLAVTRNS
eukprot:6371350-Prymnesium_polylepis.1